MNNGKICVSVCADTAGELIEQIKRAEDLADIIEIRFDCLNENELDLFLEKVSKLNCKKPFLATFRPKSTDAELYLGRRIFSDGSEYNDNKERIDKAVNYRFDGWEKILKLRNVEIIDFEQDILIFYTLPSGDENSPFGLSMISPDAEESALKRQIIFSEHFFEGISVPPYEENFLEINYEFMLKKEYEEMLAEKNLFRNDIVKIAVQASDITDSIAVWKLLERAKSENKQIIPIAMGESGKWTRILGLAHGAFMTYAALDAGQETAPGQVSAKDLIEVYRVKNLDKTTEVYGILGSNTSVSMSPYMHNAAFQFHNLNAVFVPLQVHDLDEFMSRMVKPATREVELNFKGFSVTIPHKQNIIKHLDWIDETAKTIGAVNTVKIVDGKLHGYNTDAHGFIEPLKNSYGDLKDVKVAVLGAGGAARACIYALQKEGAKVTIFARDLQKAGNLAEDFRVELSELSNKNYNEFSILVNTTPLGMKGKAENETSATAEQLRGLHLVYDLVYTPFQTRLMVESDIAEVPKIGGLAMLIAQAMEQQKIWTGKDAPMKEMSRAVLKGLR